MNSFSDGSWSQFLLSRTTPRRNRIARHLLEATVENGSPQQRHGLAGQIFIATVIAYELAGLIATVFAADKLPGLTPLVFLRNAAIGGIAVHVTARIVLGQRGSGRWSKCSNRHCSASERLSPTFLRLTRVAQSFHKRDP